MNRHYPGLALALLLGGAGLAACDRAEEVEREPAPAAAPADEQPMEGMPGMGGMPGMQGEGMMGQMHARMQMMQGMSGDSMQAMLPQHRQMVANMISQFNREMREMNMPADARWNATVDSLRQDLIRMPEMGDQELEGFMPEHHGRVMRLMEMHQAMMAGPGR